MPSIVHALGELRKEGTLKTMLLLLLARVVAEDVPSILPQAFAFNGQIAVLQLTADACKNPLGFGGTTWYCESDYSVKIRVPKKMTMGATVVTDSQSRMVAVIEVGMVAIPEGSKSAPVRRAREHNR